MVMKPIAKIYAGKKILMHESHIDLLSRQAIGLELGNTDFFGIHTPGMEERDPIDASPADFGMPNYEDVTVTNPEGMKLVGWYVPSENGATIMAQHGYRSDRVHMLEEAGMLHNQGYGVLHALDFATGQTQWKTEGVERCDGSAAVNNDVVVFGSCAAALHVYSTLDGSLLRELDLEGDSQVAGGVALVGDSVFALRLLLSIAAGILEKCDRSPAHCDHVQHGDDPDV